METKRFKPFFVVIILMLVTAFTLAFTVNVNVSDKAGVSMELPDTVGEWTGDLMLYCSNESCGKSFTVSELDGADSCPECGSKLREMALAEYRLLPKDTELIRKIYKDSFGNQLAVAIVLSGKERVSIHRPQMCLVGQGNTIQTEETIQVPVDGRDDLGVEYLSIQSPVQVEAGQVMVPRFYAYWFVGVGRETPSHYQRMVYMGIDRLIWNVAHRWAYISITGNCRDENGAEDKARLKQFVAALYPSLVIDHDK